jgi:hypothetical protein
MTDAPQLAHGAGATADASRCPRCGGDFHCGVKDETPCWCASLTLTPALLAELRREYTSCLCPACLGALAASACG